MWLSQKKTDAALPEITGGVVTIPGDSPGVMSGHERRNIRVLAPGGYVWKPGAGDEVAVLSGADGEAVAGVYTESGEILPGEVMIFSAGGALVRLKNNGDVYITGNLHVTGVIEADGNEAD